MGESAVLSLRAMHARRRGKTDRLDAAALARVLLREAGRLPPAAPEGATAVLGRLVREREDLRNEATRVRNQLHALLLRAEPGYEARLPTSLRCASGAARLAGYRAPDQGPVGRAWEAAIRRLARRLWLLLEQVEDLAARIRALAAPRYAPLAELPGVDLLTVGSLAAIPGPRTDASEAALAAYAGVAPLETSSGERVRHRLNRGGDRQPNALLHRIATTQLRFAPDARADVARRRAEGKTWREAMRALNRSSARADWRLWLPCRPSPALPLAT